MIYKSATSGVYLQDSKHRCYFVDAQDGILPLSHTIIDILKPNKVDTIGPTMLVEWVKDE